MRKLLLLTTLLVAVAAVPALAATRTVHLGDNFFSAKSLTVKRGTTITWSWSTKAPHNVVGSGGASFSSGSPKTKGHFSKRLTKAGTYRIVCVVHSEMRETVHVK